jgi:NADP-dependent 3-hydroxy acid dehydrogenase YdfG
LKENVEHVVVVGMGGVMGTDQTPVGSEYWATKFYLT